MPAKASAKKSAPPRIRRAPDEARDNILAAAETLLIERGPMALKLTDVAQAAGVAHATVLHHFGSIDGVHAALMDRMTEQLVQAILAAPMPDDPQRAAEIGLQALFEVFENRGAARLAAWLELTGEWRRLTKVREAVREVVTKRLARHLPPAQAEDIVLISVALAMGAGLFGRSLAELIGKPAGRTRKLAGDMLRGYAVALRTS